VALSRIVGAFTLFLVMGWLAAAARVRLGLDGLILSGWCSLILSGLTAVLVWGTFREVRYTCHESRLTLANKNVLLLGAIVLVYNLFALGLAAALHGTHYAVQGPTDIGWTHYFSVPSENRPTFLLHYLILSAADSTIAAPIAEELFHVGIVIGLLRACGVRWPVVFIVNACFFIAQHQMLTASPLTVAAMFGYAFGRLFLDYLFYKTGNIALPILAHILNNVRVLSLSIIFAI